MKKIGVVLSGCGVYDGAEIHEAVLTLLAIDKAGAQAVCMAPDIRQVSVVNHRTGEDAPGEKRNVLEESARIARGRIRDIKEVRSTELDGLVFPGGFGAAKNLCDFAARGGACVVHPEVSRLVVEMRSAGKPLGFVCIAPAIAARVLGEEHHVQLTIGADAATAKAIESMGARHVDCQATQFAVDKANKVVSTPAYMLATRISEVAEGVESLVRKVLELA